MTRRSPLRIRTLAAVIAASLSGGGIAPAGDVVHGTDVAVVHCSAGGAPKRTLVQVYPTKRWIERGGRQGDVPWVETARDDGSLYLRDRGRGRTMQVDLRRKKVMITPPGGQARELCVVDSASSVPDPSASSGAVRARQPAPATTPPAPAAPIVKGTDVGSVECVESGVLKATLAQVGQTASWTMTVGAATRPWTEYRRDEWSAYLRDAEGGLLQIDLYTKTITYTAMGQPHLRLCDVVNPKKGLGPPPRASAPPPKVPPPSPPVVKGPQLADVRCLNGATLKSRFTQFEGTPTWIEDAGADGTFTWTETARDEWSVYMEDPGRAVKLQIDLYTKKVTLMPSGSAPWVLCTVSDPSTVPRKTVASRVMEYVHPYTHMVTSGPVGAALRSDGTDQGIYRVQGDILVRPVRRGGPDFILADVDFSGWSDNRVPYVIAGNNPNAATVQSAIAYWNSKINVQFVPREASDDDYVEFTEMPASEMGSGDSFVGRQGGRQAVRTKAAATVGTALHEMGHAVGLHHEMSSPDRDTYLTIYFDRMKEECKDQYKVAENTQHGACGFDAGSMMMYSPRACMAGDDVVYELTNMVPVEMRERHRALYPTTDIGRWIYEGTREMFGGKGLDTKGTPKMSDCDIAGLNGLYPRATPLPKTNVPCTAAADCGGGACSRPEVDTDSRVCCASGQEAMTWGYYYCTSMPYGSKCYTDGQCASGNCDHQVVNRIGHCR